MQIDFNKKIEKVFTDLENITKSRNLLQRKVGKDQADIVRVRLKQLRGAVNFQEYLDLHIGNPHGLTGDMMGFFAVDLNAHARLIIKPDSIDLSAEALRSCNKVEIVGIIEEYHGGKYEWCKL